MKFSRMTLLSGLLIPALLLTGCKDSARTRSTADYNVTNAKKMLQDLKNEFASGRTAPAPVGASDDSRSGGEDGRLNLVVMLVAEKIPYTINKRVTDSAKKAQLAAKIKEATKLIDDTLIPKYMDAVKSKKAEDAKALVPICEQLDKHLDELAAMLD